MTQLTKAWQLSDLIAITPEGIKAWKQHARDFFARMDHVIYKHEASFIDDCASQIETVADRGTSYFDYKDNGEIVEDPVFVKQKKQWEAERKATAELRAKGPRP